MCYGLSINNFFWNCPLIPIRISFSKQLCHQSMSRSLNAYDYLTYINKYTNCILDWVLLRNMNAYIHTYTSTTIFLLIIYDVYGKTWYLILDVTPRFFSLSFPLLASLGNSQYRSPVPLEAEQKNNLETFIQIMYCSIEISTIINFFFPKSKNSEKNT